MGFDPEELRERIGALSDDELLRMVQDEADQYRPEALAVATEEIRKRGLEEEQTPDREAGRSGPVEPEEEDQEEGLLQSQQSLLCATCGSGLRPALLVGESQVVAIFEDNREQRFVRAFVCPRCGTADLFVDFETEVEV